MSEPGTGTYCAYCTAEFPDEAPDTIEQIQAHVLVCPLHPMREVERDRDQMDSLATSYRKQFDSLKERLSHATRALDLLGLALTEHGHRWTPEERSAYERATK